MTKTKLAKAVSLAVAGIALSAASSTASAASTTMYNLFTTTDALQTDGWTRVNDVAKKDKNGNVIPADGIYTGPESKGNSGKLVPWVGTPGFGLPFGYTGSSHLNWGAQIGSVGDSAEISAADAQKRYWVTAEIDTGAGAWLDGGVTPTGWKHQTDIGLIKVDQDMMVTLNPSVVTGTGYDIQNFGITVFTGMDTNTSDYSHHGGWNCPGCATPKSFTANNPFGTSGLTYLTHDGTVDAINGLTFLAKAGQIYSIYLGGAGVGHWAQNVADYKLAITTSAVPVPGAVWLFGSAMAGMLGMKRRKAIAA